MLRSTQLVKCLPEFEYFYCILENRKFISKIKRSKVTDYAALIKPLLFQQSYLVVDASKDCPCSSLLKLEYVPCCVIVINLYKHDSVFFVGHRHTVHTQIRRHRTWRLIRISTVCLQNVILKFIYKENSTQQPSKRKWTGPNDKSGKFHSA